MTLGSVNRRLAQLAKRREEEPAVNRMDVIDPETGKVREVWQLVKGQGWTQTFVEAE